MERARAELCRFEDAVNRSLRIVNRRACANTQALNKMATEINTNMGVLQAQITSLSDQDQLAPRNSLLFATPREHNPNPKVETEDNNSGNSTEGSDSEIESVNTLTGVIGQLEVFGEESVIAFDQWSERFIDYVGAMGRTWNEEERVARLKMSLVGTPRQLFKRLSQTETAQIDTAIAALRRKLDSPQRRELTKRTLAQCKQRENETVSEFIKRLTPLVEIVNSSLSDVQRKEKICEEFLDRVRSDIGFLIRLVGLNSAKDLDQVKAQAEELEAMLAAEKSSISDSLRGTVLALTNQRQSSSHERTDQPQHNNWQGISRANSTPLGYQRPYRGYSRGNSRGGYQNRNQNFNRRSDNQQMQSQRRWSNRPVCNYCGRTGHIATFCRVRQAQMVNNNGQFGRDYRNDRPRHDNRQTTNYSQSQLRNVTVLDSDSLIRAIANLSVQETRPSGSSVKDEGAEALKTISVIQDPKIEEEPKTEVVTCNKIVRLGAELLEIDQLTAHQKLAEVNRLKGTKLDPISDRKLTIMLQSLCANDQQFSRCAIEIKLSTVQLSN
ncbi:hypothetical protein niasHT_000487 [Heterodera trifolii]|uniref:CCHC-type domain-containing protein n=1 Tax=Heterodera trifolii TaxID=157864 RepID=A0ABD2LU04_9BILA